VGDHAVGDHAVGDHEGNASGPMEEPRMNSERRVMDWGARLTVLGNARALGADLGDFCAFAGAARKS
jgi:hypothetical protein